MWALFGGAKVGSEHCSSDIVHQQLLHWSLQILSSNGRFTNSSTDDIGRLMSYLLRVLTLEERKERGRYYRFADLFLFVGVSVVGDRFSIPVTWFFIHCPFVKSSFSPHFTSNSKNASRLVMCKVPTRQKLATHLSHTCTFHSLRLKPKHLRPMLQTYFATETST